MFLFGLGVGLVFASCLITLTQAPGKEISKEELERKARELGMVYREEILNFEEPEPVRGKLPEEQEDVAMIVEPIEEIKVTIPGGSTSGEIALTLKNNGVISDENEFLSLVYAQDLASRLKAGEFLFPPEATLEEVIDLITN